MANHFHIQLEIHKKLHIESILKVTQTEHTKILKVWNWYCIFQMVVFPYYIWVTDVISFTETTILFQATMQSIQNYHFLLKVIYCFYYSYGFISLSPPFLNKNLLQNGNLRISNKLCSFQATHSKPPKLTFYQSWLKQQPFQLYAHVVFGMIPQCHWQALYTICCMPLLSQEYSFLHYKGGHTVLAGYVNISLS